MPRDFDARALEARIRRAAKRALATLGAGTALNGIMCGPPPKFTVIRDLATQPQVSSSRNMEELPRETCDASCEPKHRRQGGSRLISCFYVLREEPPPSDAGTDADALPPSNASAS